ncbi:UNVERIFIED_CONTAM: hypothetical protein GTU68_013889, partial [Idotea baltica]|nr:hypothetical protein [Idotea baltica]
TVSFEESLEQLKQIVAELEAGNLPLSESLERYEQGIVSLNQCQQALEAAQKKIEVLVDLDADGNMITRPFDSTSSAQMTDGVRRAATTVSDPSVSDDVEPDEEDYDDDEEESIEDEPGLF